MTSGSRCTCILSGRGLGVSGPLPSKVAGNQTWLRPGEWTARAPGQARPWGTSLRSFSSSGHMWGRWARRVCSVAGDASFSPGDTPKLSHIALAQASVPPPGSMRGPGLPPGHVPSLRISQTPSCSLRALVACPDQPGARLGPT